MIKKNFLLEALKKILLIRVIEENFAKEYKKNKILSFLHLCIGQEASAVGVAMACNKKDTFFGNHRSHGHYLAKGGNIEKLIYECFGDQRGSVKGQGGSMHLFDKNVNFAGSVVILGSGPSIASGIAMAKKLEGNKNIVVVFVGDGSAEEGCFYETVNMAGLYKLPLLIVIEDNKYAVEATEAKRKVKNYNFKNLFSDGMRTEYIRTDGNDFTKVFEKTKILKNRILKNNKIGILHLDCIRHAKHSGANVSKEDQKSKYRKKDEYDKIFKYDPILILKSKLIRKNSSNKKLDLFEKKLRFQYKKIFYKTFNKIKLRNI
tara:strand:+ start:182 stop:1135 length:954 start_codon:yes stop_codon:yes gene_type:complete